MRIEKRGNFAAGRVVDRLVEVAGDGGAVLAFEMNVFRFRKTQLRDQRVVGFGETGEVSAIRKIDFIGTIERGNLCGDGAVVAE